MPEAVLSALLGLFGLYVAGVTFSLQQLSDRYSPRLLPQLRRRHVSPHLGVLAGLVAVAGGLVAGRAQDWATPAALGLLIASVGYALWLLPQGWGLASLDARRSWLQPDDLTPDIVQDMLSRLAQRRDGVALIAVLEAVHGDDQLEWSVSSWLRDHPDLLAEAWCGPVVVLAWTKGLTEANAARRQGVLLETVARRLVLPGAPEVSHLVLTILAAVGRSDTWGDDLQRLVVNLGQELTYEPGSEVFRPLTPGVQNVQGSFELRVGILRKAAMKRSAQDAAWFAFLLGELLTRLPHEAFIGVALNFARELPPAWWSFEVAVELLGGLERSRHWPHRAPEYVPTAWQAQLGEPWVADTTLAILRAMREVDLPEDSREYLAGKVNLGPDFQRRKEEAIGLTRAVEVVPAAPEHRAERGWRRAVRRLLGQPDPQD